MIRDSYYSESIENFLKSSKDSILGELAQAHQHALEHQQRDAWLVQIDFLKRHLSQQQNGHLFLEFAIPRMGKRADVVLFINSVVYVVEFKVNAKGFDSYAVDQVHDYALDLKNFHLGSHGLPIVPILCATDATQRDLSGISWADDWVCEPILVGRNGLNQALDIVPESYSVSHADLDSWRNAGYRPTPTIIEAAEALYRSHAVEEISRSDAGAKNLQSTSDKIAQIIDQSKRKRLKSICFITGVPGAGKTLAGLNIAAKRVECHQDEHAVFLSGNGPLVDVLREALARDQVSRTGDKKSDALRSVRRFIQNIHHFRDHYLSSNEVPFEKVVVFDEAQRAWTKNKASNFMKSKRGYDSFSMSEPEFLISVMNRHKDWCTIICLIGGGQEINTGEAGLSEWLEALRNHFPDWNVHASSLLDDRHYTVDQEARRLLSSQTISKHPELHLSVSMRSFRAEKLSAFVGELLDGNARQARVALESLEGRYPIAVTRDLEVARNWLRDHARGTERFGLIASAGGYRLRPEGIYVKAKIDPAGWFLNDKYDVRSSYYLEEAATQFDVQGLELDWAGVCWDADLRWVAGQWSYHSFKGTKWQNINETTNQLYLLNAYRVLLTRARQGMVIFVPKGDSKDHTRPPSFYDGAYDFMLNCGIQSV